MGAAAGRDDVCRASTRIGPIFLFWTRLDSPRIRIWQASASPDSIPLNYYSRLTETAPLPPVVLEGGWSSVPVGNVAFTPEMQAEYLHRQAAILDVARAAALFQITFTDLDVSGFPVPPGTSLGPFAHIGLVDSALAPKPALAAWDSVFARPYRP